MNLSYDAHVFRSPAFQGIVDQAIAFFNSTQPYDFPPEARFIGCGVYSLYYVGDHQPYRRMGQLNRQHPNQPIYVGKAVPVGWRTARDMNTEAPKLYQRLREHARSIAQADNLDLGEFQFRFMILKDLEIDLIVPVEAELIRRYAPLWNSVIDGFGNHDPGSGRYDQAPSEWDVLHPGRPWANKLRGEAPQLTAVRVKVQEALKG